MVNLNQNEYVYKERDQNLNLYIIVEGRIEITKEVIEEDPKVKR